MKKLLSALLALSLLGLFVADADARCGRGRCGVRRCVKRCPDNDICKPTHKCEAPKVTERHWTIYKPCCKWIKVQGVCPFDVCERCVTTQSAHCTGPCQAYCANAVNVEDRGPVDGQEVHQAGEITGDYNEAADYDVKS